jgi:hypothetical protein
MKSLGIHDGDWLRNDEIQRNTCPTGRQPGENCAAVEDFFSSASLRLIAIGRTTPNGCG